MFQIDPLSRIPVYEQIIEQMERFVLAGLLKPGTQLPSVRSLSAELSINPNTIQKAYSELDLRGVIYSVPGIGCFVSENAVVLLEEYQREKLGVLDKLLQDLALAGVAKEEILRCVERIYALYPVGHSPMGRPPSGGGEDSLGHRPL